MLRSGVFLLALVGAVASASLLDGYKRLRRNAEERTLEIRDLTGHSGEAFPKQLELEFRVDGEVERVTVKRNLHFNEDVAVESSENGERKRHATETLPVAEYLSRRAALHVTATRDGQRYRRTFSGLFHKRDKTYMVEAEREKRTADHRAVVLETPPASDYKIPDRVRMHDALIPPKTAVESYRRGSFRRGTKLVVDVLMIIDYGVYKIMSDMYRDYQGSERESRTVGYIKRLYGVFWAGVAQKYEQVNYNGMTIMPRLSRMLILTSERDDDAMYLRTKSGRDVDSYPALKHINHWFQAEKRQGRYSDIDHAMVFTNHRMFSVQADGSKSFGVVGLAYVGNVCKYWQASLVEDDLTFRVIGTAAHELGHNLGAPHDELPNCDPSYSYQMSPWVTDGNSQTFGNQYKFSQCSLKAMYENMRKLNDRYSNCMTESAEQGQHERVVSEVIPGLTFDLSQQCQMLTGQTESYFCGEKRRLRDGVCRGMQCYVKGRGCRGQGSRHALHGTPCGQSMWCENGHCQSAPRQYHQQISDLIRRL